MKIHGIDVSEFQGNIDFKKVKNSGIEFVMVRAGYDYVNGDDKYWEQNVYNANKYGLHVGAYWFMYFVNETEAKNCADKFIRMLNKFKGKIDYPVALDVEEDTYKYMKSVGVNPTKEVVTNLVNIFCDRVEKAGYYTMIYSNYNGFNNYMGNVSRFDKWLAYLGNAEITYDDCGIWQHSFSGKVGGIRDDVDLDISFVEYDKIIRSAGLNKLTDEIKDDKPIEDDNKNNIKVGDIVRVTNPIIYGTNKKFTLWYENYIVMEVVGDRAVIGKGGSVTAPIDVKYLRKV